MAERSHTTERLDSWKDIATYLGRNVRTAMRWEQGKGLPVHRLPGGQRQAVFAWRHELDAWMKNGDSLVEEVIKDNVANHGSGDTPEAITVDDLVPIPSPKSPSGPIPLREPFHPKRTAWIVGIATLLVIGSYIVVHKFEFASNVKFTNVAQITGDGAMKYGLVTDGRTLYFGEYQESRTVLSSVAVSGGPVKRIPTPFVRVIPIDISPDRSSLLALVSEGRPEEEGSLWIIPVAGSQLRPVGKVRCHAAAWSPDGKRIAIASETGIYLTADEGVSLHLVQSFDAVPMGLRWSYDGMTLRTELRDERSMTFSFWDLHLASPDSFQVSTLVPLNAHTDAFNGSMTLDREGRSFAVGGNPWKENMFVLAHDRKLWNPQFTLKPLESPINSLSSLALDPETKRIFAIGSSAALEGDTNEHADLIRFDPTAHEFRPFLPGIFAEYVDFSRDGQSIAYVRRPDLTVWVSRPDGSNARQLAFPGVNFELPRLSPDGKQVAVMAKLPSRPWRIFVAGILVGKPKEASVGNSSQGAPTWSPDGKKLVYGNVECQENGSCAIHEIDVSTGREFTVPGSEGLGTARWSPDGRYIAALNPIRHEVLMFEIATQEWRKLMDGVNGNDLSWSEDSRYLFASRLGGSQPEILRISLKDGKIERVVDLSDFAKLRGRVDTWFTVAPQGSIIFSHELGSNEIYALDYQDR
jgi:hypothetical protein